MCCQPSRLHAGFRLKGRRPASAPPAPRRGCTSHAPLRAPSASEEPRERVVELRELHVGSRGAVPRVTWRRTEDLQLFQRYGDSDADSSAHHPEYCPTVNASIYCSKQRVVNIDYGFLDNCNALQ